MSTTKLSTLIREGAKLRPMFQGDYFGYIGEDEEDEDKTTGVFGSCAIGAAWEALTGTTECNDRTVLEELATQCGLLTGMQYDRYVRIRADYKTSGVGSIFNVITHLNDLVEDMTREKIADYIEGEGY